MQTITIAGPQGPLAALVSKTGPGVPALLIHADLGTRHQWDELLAALAGTRPVAAFDRRGHGDSAPPADGRFGAAAEPGDVLAVADALGFDRFALIGHSGGAAVAFQLANTVPARVAGLLLLDPPPDPAVIPAEQRSAMLEGVRKDAINSAAEYYRSIAGPDSRVVERIVADARATAPATIQGVTEATFEFDPAAVAGHFAGPALSIIQPQFDVPGALHRLGRGMPHRPLANAGHWLHLGAPAEVARMLDEFLVSVDEMALA